MFLKVKDCEDCGPLPVNHFSKWTEDFLNISIAPIFELFVPLKLYYFIDQFIYKAFIFCGLFSLAENIDCQKVSLRTTVFTKEAEKKGIVCKNLISSLGPTNYFQLPIGKKFIFFEGLPRLEEMENRLSKTIDDKWAVKKILQKAGLPVSQGKSFWWFQKEQAKNWAIKEPGFPLIVKPRFGSMSQHITAPIQDAETLVLAIKKVVEYCPAFLVEKFLDQASVYRATVVDFKEIACVRRIPAQVRGDGKRTIQELIKLKNSDPRRGQPRQKDTTLYKIVTNNTTDALLKKKNYSYQTVPAKGETIYLQEKVILDLGADLNEETARIHPDNLELFRKTAELFNVRLVGIDFLIKDISLSWKTNPSAIIELNSLPYIDMHHFPTDGSAVNVAGYLCEMVEKYYRFK